MSSVLDGADDFSAFYRNSSQKYAYCATFDDFTPVLTAAGLVVPRSKLSAFTAGKGFFLKKIRGGGGGGSDLWMCRVIKMEINPLYLNDSTE